MSSVLKDPYAEEVDMLALEPVPELNELLEWEPPMDDPEFDPALLLRDVLEPVAAMGADTLLV